MRKRLLFNFKFLGLFAISLVLFMGLEATSFQTTSEAINGGGTVNVVPKFIQDGTVIGNSIISETDGRVGIGVDAPFFDFEVNGSVLLGNFEGLFVDLGGQVGIGTTSPDPTVLLDVRGGAIIDGTLQVSGDVEVTGRVQASAGFNGLCTDDIEEQFIEDITCNQDLAEAYFSAEATEPGDLLILTTNQAATVRRSSQPYDPMLVGVVSTNPGLLFDHGQTSLSGDNSGRISETQTIVALTGRVPVKVSIENGPIQIGDPITSSSQTGRGMKAIQAGKIIGYALEAASSDGLIVVMVQPGHYQGEAGLQPYIDLIEQQEMELKQLRADHEALQAAWETLLQRLETLEAVIEHRN